MTPGAPTKTPPATPRDPWTGDLRKGLNVETEAPSQPVALGATRAVHDGKSRLDAVNLCPPPKVGDNGTAGNGRRIVHRRAYRRGSTAALQRIGALNDQLIGLENDFSRTLGEGFDLTSNFLFYAMIAIDVLIVVIGFLLSRTVGRSIAGDIGELSKSVAKIEAGDFSTRSSIDSADELGDLARALNSMAWNIGRARRELERARDAAMQTSLSKSSFLANLSHEIRTPVHVMLGYADIIGRELGNHPDPVLAGHVDTMRRAGHRLVDTIQGILDFSESRPTPSTCIPHR